MGWLGDEMEYFDVAVFKIFIIYLNHMQIDGLSFFFDGQHSINNNLSKKISNLSFNLTTQTISLNYVILNKLINIHCHWNQIENIP